MNRGSSVIKISRLLAVQPDFKSRLGQ